MRLFYGCGLLGAALAACLSASTASAYVMNRPVYRPAPVYHPPVQMYRPPVYRPQYRPQYRAPMQTYRPQFHNRQTYRPQFRAPAHAPAYARPNYRPNVRTPMRVAVPHYRGPIRPMARPLAHIPHYQHLPHYRPWRWAAGTAVLGTGAYYYWSMPSAFPVLVPNDDGLAFDVEEFIRSLADDGTIADTPNVDDMADDAGGE